MTTCVQPREKGLQRGIGSLRDDELLALMLRTGCAGESVLALAARLLREFGSLRSILLATPARLMAVKGLGPAKYLELQAVLELGKRVFLQSIDDIPLLDSAEQTRLMLLAQFQQEKREVFAVLFLNSQYRLLHYEAMFSGTINAAGVYPRVIVQKALEVNAAAVILAHNHPSGYAEPSDADRSITLRVQQALKLVDIAVLDHFVVGAGYAVSFAERGLLHQ